MPPRPVAVDGMARSSVATGLVKGLPSPSSAAIRPVSADPETAGGQMPEGALGRKSIRVDSSLVARVGHDPVRLRRNPVRARAPAIGAPGAYRVVVTRLLVYGGGRPVKTHERAHPSGAMADTEVGVVRHGCRRVASVRHG